MGPCLVLVLLVCGLTEMAVLTGPRGGRAGGHAGLEVHGFDPSTTSLAETRMKADVSFLAADAREGRAPGTKGIEASAD